MRCCPPHSLCISPCISPYLPGGVAPFGDINALHAFFLWYYPWAVTGAIWTVMTQVSHVQEDCQRPRTGDPDDYFRWQIESAVDYSVHSELVPKLTASLSLQSMHHVFPSVCGCHSAWMKASPRCASPPRCA